mgnify:FL=1
MKVIRRAAWGQDYFHCLSPVSAVAAVTHAPAAFVTASRTADDDALAGRADIGLYRPASAATAAGTKKRPCKMQGPGISVPGTEPEAQSGLTLTAAGPFLPCSTSNSTC